MSAVLHVPVFTCSYFVLVWVISYFYFTWTCFFIALLILEEDFIFCVYLDANAQHLLEDHDDLQILIKSKYLLAYTSALEVGPTYLTTGH